MKHPALLAVVFLTVFCAICSAVSPPIDIEIYPQPFPEEPVVEDPIVPVAKPSAPPTRTEIEQCVKQFDDREATVRESAIRRLWAYPQSASELTVQAFRTGNLNVRLTALELLKEWNAPIEPFDPWNTETFTPELLSALETWQKETASKIPTTTNRELTAAQRAEASEEISRMLRVSDEETEAIRARLARLETALLPLVYERLKTAITDRDRQRLQALRYRLVASETLAAQRPEALLQLASPETAVRRKSADELANLATVEDQFLLRELFSDPDPLVREISLRGLQKTGGAAQTMLLELLADPEPNVRAAVLKQLEDKPNASVSEKIIEYVKTETDADLVGHAVRVLRQLQKQNDKATRSLIELLQHESWQVRADAAAALSERERGSGKFDRTLENEVQNALTELLKDNDSFVVSKAIDGLRGADSLAVGQLLEVIERFPELASHVVTTITYRSEMRSSAMTQLRRFIEHENPEVRAAIFESLHDLGEKELAIGMADSDSRVRIAAANALRRNLDSVRQRALDRDNDYSYNRATVEIQSSPSLLTSVGRLFGSVLTGRPTPPVLPPAIYDEDEPVEFDIDMPMPTRNDTTIAVPVVIEGLVEPPDSEDEIIEIEIQFDPPAISPQTSAPQGAQDLAQGNALGNNTTAKTAALQGQDNAATTDSALLPLTGRQDVEADSESQGGGEYALLWARSDALAGRDAAVDITSLQDDFPVVPPPPLVAPIPIPVEIVPIDTTTIPPPPPPGVQLPPITRIDPDHHNPTPPPPTWIVPPVAPPQVPLAVAPSVASPTVIPLRSIPASVDDDVSVDDDTSALQNYIAANTSRVSSAAHDQWLTDFYAGKKRPDWAVNLIEPLEKMLAAESVEERVAAATVLVPLGKADEMIPLLMELTKEKPELFNSSTIFPWLTSEKRLALFQEWRATHKPDARQLAGFFESFVEIAPDIQQENIFWDILGEENVSDEIMSVIYEPLRTLYMADSFVYNRRNAPPKKVQAELAEKLVTRAQSGTEHQRLAALAVLVSIDVEKASEVAKRIDNDAASSAELRRDAFQVRLLTQTNETLRTELALETLKQKDTARSRLAIRSLVSNEDSYELYLLRRGMFLQLPSEFEMSFDQQKSLTVPKGIDLETIKPLMKDESDEIAAYAGYFAVLLGESSGMEPLLKFWRKNEDAESLSVLVYRAIGSLDDSQYIPILREIYEKLDEYEVRDFYWHIRRMTGSAILPFRKEIRDKWGMDVLQ